MAKKRCKYPWKFHGAGAIECLEHSPGRVIYAGTCPECIPKPPLRPVPDVAEALTPIPDSVPLASPYDA